MFVKPAPDRSVIDPVTHEVLPADGAEKPETDFWLRRLRDNDVVEVPAGVPVSRPRPATEE